jgi:hypothetical protein
MAVSFYGIKMAFTLSFSNAGNMFVGTLREGTHVILSKHISRMRNDTSLAILLCQRMAETGMTNLTAVAAYDTLASYLRRAPGQEAGRSRVLLPTLDEIASTFSEQVSEMDDLLSRIALETKIKKAESANKPENKIKYKEYLQKPEVKIRRRGYKKQPKHIAKAKENRKRPEVVARQKVLRNSDEAKAKRTTKRHAQRTSHGRSTKSERRETRRIGLANPDWSADELATWAFDTYGLKVKAQTVSTWLAARYSHLDADSEEEDDMQPDNADENDDKMEYEEVDQVDDEMV